ncbi:MAG: thioredoxin domain-containing protein [Caldilineaceae bacterium]|nr:thioredoxin domain-containing protein [Caldilineaceae bacterium]
MLSRYYSLSQPVTSDDHSQGPDNAPVTLVEYADYQCPYCGQAHPIVKQIQAHFGDSLRFVFRNFPLAQMHVHALKAAEAAEIAREYGKFWAMHDLLYEHQDRLDRTSLLGYARQLGIDESEFARKLDADEKADRIKEEFMGGVNSGVNGTPSFFINGVKYENSWDYESLKEAIALSSGSR